MRGWLYSLLALGLSVATSGHCHLMMAAEFRSGEKITIAAEETIDDDLYVFGQEIVIDGTVNGDVIGWGQQITVNGTVRGHIMVAGQTVVITGSAEGARIAGQVLKIGSQAKLAGDLLAAGMSLECEKSSDISGDALYAGYQALFAGKVGSDLKGGMANCRVEGSVGGDVNVEVGGDKKAKSATSFGPPPPVSMPNVPGGFTVANSASIEGDLNYQSPQEAEIGEEAKVGGEVHFRQQVKAEKNGKAGAAAAAANQVSRLAFVRLRHILSVLLVGLVVVLLFPRTTTTWVETIRQRPAASFLSGLAGFAAFFTFLVLMVILIVLASIFFFGTRITELGPLVLVGGFVGYSVVIVGFWIVSAFLAEAITGLAIGRMAIQSNSFGARLGALLIGVLLLGLVLSVPYLGGLLGFVVLIFGLGSICLWLTGQSNIQSFEPLPPAAKFPV